MPSSAVMMKPPGSRPGISSLATMPASRPMMIVPMMCMATSRDGNKTIAGQVPREAATAKVLLGEEAAVDGEDVPRHHRRGAAGKEEHGADDLLGLGEATQGRHALDLGEKL